MTRWRTETIGESIEFVGFDVRVAVYEIQDIDGRSMYVGTTSQPIKHRISMHISAAKKGSDLPVHTWMRDSKFKFSIHRLEWTTTRLREMLERQYIIERRPQLNVTDGGPGMSGHRFAGTAHAKRIGEARKRGSECTCHQCGKMFWARPSDIALGNAKFCERSCYQTWQRGKPKVRRAA